MRPQRPPRSAATPAEEGHRKGSTSVAGSDPSMSTASDVLLDEPDVGHDDADADDELIVDAVAEAKSVGSAEPPSQADAETVKATDAASPRYDNSHNVF